MKLPLSDLHTHTLFCDGKGTPEETVKSAITRGFHTIGFSAHSVTEFDRTWCLKDEPAYYDEISRLKKAYNGVISVQCGLELDALSELPTMAYDYLIGSVHYFSVNGKFYPIDESPKMLAVALSDGFSGNEHKLTDVYFESVVDMAKRHHPDIIGHFDLLSKFAERNSPVSTDSDYYRSAGEEALTELIACGCDLMEVNTGAISRGYRSTPYPAVNFLQRWHKLGGRVILSSDAHTPDTIGYCFPEALRLLTESGYSTLFERRGGEFVINE